jgi:hypothetical protein
MTVGEGAEPDELAEERQARDAGDLSVDRLRRVEIARPGLGAAKATLAVRFDPDALERLRRMADGQGVGITQLVRSWVLDRLTAEEAGPASLIDAVNQLDAGVDRIRRLVVNPERGSAAKGA